MSTVSIEYRVDDLSVDRHSLKVTKLQEKFREVFRVIWHNYCK